MKKMYGLALLLGSITGTAQINKGNLLTKDKYFRTQFTETIDEIHTKATLRGDELDFMLDTGAPTFISTDLQKKYKFKSLYKVRTGDASGNKVKTEIVVIDTIRFGPFVFTDIPAIVIDMKKSPIECLNLTGNIGSNMLRYLYVQFDIQEQAVSFTDNKTLLKKQISTTFPMMVNGQSDVYFPIKLNENFIDTIHYDSGDGQFYSMSKHRMDKYIASYPADIIRDGYGTMFMGIGGSGEYFPQHIVKPAKIRVGNKIINDAAVTIAGNDNSRMGRDLLNYGILQLNYPDSNYAFEGYSAPKIPPHFDYGFHCTMDDDEIVLGCVWKDTPAEKGGMQPGDRILQIDNLDLTTLGKCEAANAVRGIKHNEKNKITVTFRHKKQEPKTITIEKKSL